MRRILKRLGLPKSRYYEWKRARSRSFWTTGPRGSGSPHAILEEEKQAVIRYALAHPKDGYRQARLEMVDEDVAYVSPSSVYRILNDADLLYRWKREPEAGSRLREPTAERALAHGHHVPAGGGHLVLPGDGAGRLQPVRGALGAADDDDGGGGAAGDPGGAEEDGREAQRS
jgi:transposase